MFFCFSFFVVLLPKTSRDYALEVAERICLNVSSYDFKLSRDSVSNITISIGVSMLPLNIVNGDIEGLAEKLVAHADQALYKAKKAGRDQVIIASND